MPKQTSIDWLVNELKKSKHYQRMINEVHQNSTVAIDVIEQAKAMEKEQIVDAWKDAEGYNDENAVILAKQYYNETYGGQDGC